MFLLAFVGMTVYNVQQNSYNFELSSCITSSAHWSSNLASTVISFIKRRYVYNLVFGRISETNGVGDSTDEIGVDLTLSVVNPLHGSWLVSPFQPLYRQCGKAANCKRKEQSGNQYPNLFKGRKPYRLKIHLKTLRRSLSRN